MAMISGIYKSILKSTNALVTEIKTTMPNPTLQYWGWEQRLEEQDLPKVDLIGMDGYSFEENRGLWTIRYAIGVSSYRDPNLLEESEMLDIIHERTGEGKKIALLDATTGAQISEMVTAHWQLMPMSSSELRNYRMVAIELLRTSNTS